MKVFSAVFLLGVVAFVVSAQDSYPTTYPYENEIYKPLDPPPSEPNYTYDPATDVGGYIHTYVILRDLNTVEWPFCPTYHGCMKYLLVAVFGAPPQLPPQAVNCTAKGISFDQSHFTGIVTGSNGPQTVCNVGSCCSYLVGKLSPTEDISDLHTWLDNLVSVGLCGDITEEVYCDEVAGHFQTDCFEWWPGPVERLAVLTCLDEHMLFWLSCPIIVSTGELEWGWPPEPPLYTADLSAEEKMTVQVYVLVQDRICHPHSYYSPDDVASTTASTTGGASDASEVPSDASKSSNASETSSAALALLTVLYFML